MTQKLVAKEIGQRIRTQLQIRNLTVVKAASLCGMPKPTLEDHLYGKSLPGAEALASMARGFGCTVDWLLFGTVAK